MSRPGHGRRHAGARGRDLHAVRLANRSARVAERTLLAGLRPVLVPSRDDDPDESVRFGDGVTLVVGGDAGALEVHDDRVYVAMALRNGRAAWRSSTAGALRYPS